ncbi:hypothetical protein EDD90_11024, partial [Streptomyces sp. Ag109_O5-1]|uniref:hypothetical protein n=1 Tax=Streptomyces sp. Ag109_O5-1 TaxID=1938851 RepID=UPI000F95160B
QVTARPTGHDGSARTGWRINPSALTGDLEKSGLSRPLRRVLRSCATISACNRAGACSPHPARRSGHQLGPAVIDALAAWSRLCGRR